MFATRELTDVVVWPVSEPAPEPKPRLLLVDCTPALPVPAREAISERSALLSAPTAPVRFLVSIGRSCARSRRRSASSSFTRFSCFSAFLRASAVRSTG